MTDYKIHAQAVSLPRTPTFDSGTTAEWSPPTLRSYVQAFGTDDDSGATQVSQLSDASKSAIAARTLMGRATATTVDGLISYPVVTTDGNLSSQALRSAHQLAFNSSKENDIQNITARLLDDVFDVQIGDRAEESAAQNAEAQQASGTIDVTAEVGGDGLTGVIWSTGTHSLELGGRGTRVTVPKSTIKPTFEELKERIKRGEATIGFDHVDKDSVAGNTSIGEIGKMQEVRLSDDGESIVLTKSELTNNKAQQAYASGDFGGYDFSFVGRITPEHTEGGEMITDGKGAIKVKATHIEQVDVVRNGAVDNAQIGRVPALAAEVSELTSSVAEPPTTARVEQTLTNIGAIKHIIKDD